MASIAEPHATPTASALAAKLLPELAVIACVIWLLLAPIVSPKNANLVDFNSLLYVVIADGATLMMSGTLIDIASRLKRPPPWWVLPIAVAVILLLYPEVIELLTNFWQLGGWVFLPFAWSIFERVYEIWTLPSATRLEKIRRRVLTFDRLYSGIAVGCAFIVLMLASILIVGFKASIDSMNEYIFWPILVFYAVNAANVLRVHRPRFSQSPRSLWPKFDGGEGIDLRDFRP